MQNLDNLHFLCTFARELEVIHDILFYNALQGRVKFPIGGIVREPQGRTVATTVPTVTVWMKEKQK